MLCCPACPTLPWPGIRNTPGTQRFVRVTHWITTVSFFALLVTGVEIVISHPRFYWGETGNDLTTPLFKIPIPASRNLVPTGYGYVLPDQNGWSRYLHFQAAWVVVLTGLVYAICGSVDRPLPEQPVSGSSRPDVAGVPRGDREASSPRAAGRSRSSFVQRTAAGRIPDGDLRPVSAGDLDGSRIVARLQFRGSGGRQCTGRTAIRAHASFLRLRHFLCSSS